MAPSVCIYCGSRLGARPAYREAAAAAGRALAEAGFHLVYGAGDNGLMGVAARAAQAGGARITGFMPRHLLALEVGKRDLHSLIVTETMHERKTLMLANADAVLALPGGAGTLDELFEVLTWRQLGLHGKPIVLLDTEDFWRPFVDLIAHLQAEGFVSEEFSRYFRVVPSADAAVEALAAALERRSGPPG